MALNLCQKDDGVDTGHPWHCPVCDCHLSRDYVCAGCGARYTEPAREELYHALALRLAERVPEQVLLLAAELATGKNY